MEQYELSLNWLDAEVIDDFARRQDYYEALERDNKRLAHERDIAVDQRNITLALLFVCAILTVGRWVIMAVRG